MDDALRIMTRLALLMMLVAFVTDTLSRPSTMGDDSGRNNLIPERPLVLMESCHESESIDFGFVGDKPKRYPLMC